MSSVSYHAKRDRDEIPLLFTRICCQHVTQTGPHPVIKHMQTTEPASQFQRAPCTEAESFLTEPTKRPGTSRLSHETHFASLSLQIYQGTQHSSWLQRNLSGTMLSCGKNSPFVVDQKSCPTTRNLEINVKNVCENTKDTI